MKEFADDFGYDLDEEGQPLDDGRPDRGTTASATRGAGDGAATDAEEPSEPEPEPEPAAV